MHVEFTLWKERTNALRLTSDLRMKTVALACTRTQSTHQLMQKILDTTAFGGVRRCHGHKVFATWACGPEFVIPWLSQILMRDR